MQYEKSFGYGRPYRFIDDCEKCRERGICADAVIFYSQNSNLMIQKYLTKEIDLECLSSSESLCSARAYAASQNVAEKLLSMDIASLVALLRLAKQREMVTTDNIPQYGDLSVAMYLVPEILSHNNPMGYVEFGKKLFYREGKNDVAYRKYAENHCKLATQLDLAKISKKGNTVSMVSCSVMGKYFLTLLPEEKDCLLQRLCLRIPIIQNALMNSNWQQSVLEDLSILSESTRDRRMRDVIEIIRFVIDE